MDYQKIYNLFERNQIEEALRIMASDQEYLLDKYATDNDEFSDVEASQVSNFMPIPSKIPESSL